MSSPHRLTPPPNYTPVLLAVVIGVGLAVVTNQLTRSTLPHVGDNIHSLPHGGNYQDGTKSVIYRGPAPFQRSHSTAPPFIAVLLLTFAIWFLSCRTRRAAIGIHVCHTCSQTREQQ
nr:TGB2 [Hosta virus X]